jgi:hypothetical protein
MPPSGGMAFTDPEGKLQRCPCGGRACRPSSRPQQPSPTATSRITCHLSRHPLMTLHTLKPRFQSLLRPAVRSLHGAGVSANQVTVSTGVVSVALGAGLAVAADAGQLQWFLLLPPWFLLRMALNAIDGLLAREFGQRSTLGAYLNELSDLVADAALYLPFAFAERSRQRADLARHLPVQPCRDGRTAGHRCRQRPPQRWTDGQE